MTGDHCSVSNSRDDRRPQRILPSTFATFTDTSSVAVDPFALGRDNDFAIGVRACEIESVLIVEFVVGDHIGNVRLGARYVRLLEILTSGLDPEDVLAGFVEITDPVTGIDAFAIAFTDHRPTIRRDAVETGRMDRIVSQEAGLEQWDDFVGFDPDVLLESGHRIVKEIVLKGRVVYPEGFTS